MNRVDYDEAVKAYEERLDTVLRGFRSSGPLDLWVPDEDPVKSLLNLFEAAAAAGLDALEVSVGAETSARLDLVDLEARVADLAEMTVEEEQGGLRLSAILHHEVTSPAAAASAPARAPRAAPPAASPIAPRSALRSAPRSALRSAPRSALHPSYAARADGRAQAVAHEGPLEPTDAGALLLTTPIGAATLRLAVRSTDRVVTHAAHQGATGASRGVLDAWCAIVLSLPLEEACEHGVHRVMDLLRDPEAPPPVRGVVTPRNASPLFGDLLDASQRMMRAFVERVGEPVPDSTYHAPPSPRWIVMSEADRIAEIRDVLGSICESLGIDPATVEASGMRGVAKVLFDFADSVPIALRGHALLRIEAELQRRVEPALVVEREAQKDLNVIRRL